MPSLWMWVLTEAMSLWALFLTASSQSVDDVTSYLWEEYSIFIFFFFYLWWNVALKTHVGVVFHQNAILDL